MFVTTLKDCFSVRAQGQCGQASSSAPQRGIAHRARRQERILSISGWPTHSMTLTRFQIAGLPQRGQLARIALEISLQSSQTIASLSGIKSIFSSLLATTFSLLRFPVESESAKSRTIAPNSSRCFALRRAYANRSIFRSNLLHRIRLHR
jgi:hypothetical protein